MNQIMDDHHRTRGMAENRNVVVGKEANVHTLAQLGKDAGPGHLPGDGIDRTRPPNYGPDTTMIDLGKPRRDLRTRSQKVDRAHT
jgi:hypothetical protein